MIVVSDTSPILSLIYIQQLHLLPLLFKQVVVPVGVERELMNSRLSEEQKNIFKAQIHISVKAPSDQSAVKNIISNDLHLPEAEAIILALELHADFILIDENIGRAIAANKGLTIVGVLGILLKAKQQNLIPAIKPLMDILVAETGFWISKNLYKQLLQLSNENES